MISSARDRSPLRLHLPHHSTSHLAPSGSHRSGGSVRLTRFGAPAALAPAAVNMSVVSGLLPAAPPAPRSRLAATSFQDGSVVGVAEEEVEAAEEEEVAAAQLAVESAAEVAAA